MRGLICDNCRATVADGDSEARLGWLQVGWLEVGLQDACSIGCAHALLVEMEEGEREFAQQQAGADRAN